MCVSQNQKKHTTLKTDDCYYSCLASLSLNFQRRAKEVCTWLPIQTACCIQALASAGSASFDFAAAFSASLHQQYCDELQNSTTHNLLSPQQNM